MIIAAVKPPAAAGIGPRNRGVDSRARHPAVELRQIFGQTEPAEGWPTQTRMNFHPMPRPLAQAGAIDGDAVADLAELLDVDMDHLAGPLPLIATGRLGRLQSAQPRETKALEDAARRGSRDADLGDDRQAGQPAFKDN